MKKLIFISITILTTLSCCKKEELKNPEDYKFYCKVDGVVWKRTDQNYFCPGCSPLQSDYYPNGSRLALPGKLEILAHRIIESKGISQLIYIVVYGLREGDNLDSLRIRGIYTDYNELCVSIVGHSLDTNYMNTFFISKLDSVNRRIVGNFDLRVIDEKCTPPDTIRITEGHFDLNPAWHP